MDMGVRGSTTTCVVRAETCTAVRAAYADMKRSLVVGIGDCGADAVADNWGPSRITGNGNEWVDGRLGPDDLATLEVATSIHKGSIVGGGGAGGARSRICIKTGGKASDGKEDGDDIM